MAKRAPTLSQAIQLPGVECGPNTSGSRVRPRPVQDHLPMGAMCGDHRPAGNRGLRRTGSGLLRPNLLGSRVAHSASTAILTMDGVVPGGRTSLFPKWS